MKKMLAVVLAVLMVLSLAACGGSSAPAATEAPAAAAPAATEAPAAEAPATEAPAKVYNIGICQLVQHPALDAATQGFKDILTEKLGDSV